MPRKVEGTDGQPLEWAIQQEYVDACLQLCKSTRNLSGYFDKKANIRPSVLQFHMGNANGGKTFMTEGIPDTLTLYTKVGGEQGRLWIEFKRHNGKPSPMQIKIIEMMQNCGEDVIVCYSAKEAIDALLKRIGLVNQRR